MSSLLQTINHELITLVESVLLSTVSISGTSDDLSMSSSGSGWVFSEGVIVTNHHVIDGLVDPIQVQPPGQRDLVGKLVGSDPDNDIAVLRVNGLSAKPLCLELEPPKLGELCLAIGSPLGLRESASLGIISGLSRQSKHPDGAIIEEMLQTDASINPGNSGGPLLNIEGKLLGMNTMGPAETVNLAVSAETIAAVVPELLAHGSIMRATIGISVAATQLQRGNYNKRGIEVRRIRDTANNCLQPGDLLIEINGYPIKRRIDVIRALGRETVDTEVAVLVERNGEHLTLQCKARQKS